MLRFGAIVLLVILGCVSAVMAIGGLPWRAGNPAVERPVAPQGGEAARAMTDQAVAQLRRAPHLASDDMQAMTRSVVEQLHRSQGTPLQRAVRLAMQADMGDVRVQQLLTGTPQTRPAQRPLPRDERLQDLVRRSLQAAP